MAWHEPTTENPKNGTTEEWEIWNLSGDAHPMHLHLVMFEVIGREEIVWDTAVREADDKVLSDPDDAFGDGTYLAEQPLVQHNGALGSGFRVVNPTKGAAVETPANIYETGPKDMVTAMPGEVTRFKMIFDKAGRFVWHCHILAHEDHEMMRTLVVSSDTN
jgi:spore coat protein A